MRLSDAGIGAVVRVVDFRGRAVRERLRRMGLYPGDDVKVLRRAPLGGPVLISASGRELALGAGVAAKVIVEIA